MAKISKRAKKFEAKGGVKTLLTKGSIAKKGKSKSNRHHEKKGEQLRKGSGHSGPSRKQSELKNHTDDDRRKREENDFLGENNLGSLNLEEFLTSVADYQDESLNYSSTDEDNNDVRDKKKIDDSSDEDEKDSVDVDGDDSSSNEDASISSSFDGDIEDMELQMRAEMAKLADTDPEFHKYLIENESSLLEFREDEDDIHEMDIEKPKEDDIVIDPNQDNKAKHDEKRVKDQSDGRILFTAKVLHSYEQGAFRSHGIKSLRRIVAAYKSACNTADAVMNESTKSDFVPRSYEFQSPFLMNRVLVVCLKQCHGEFYHHLLGPGATFSSTETQQHKELATISWDPNKPINPRKMAKSIRWIDVRPIMNTFFKASLQLLNESKDPSLISFVLKSLTNYIPFLSDFQRVSLSYLKKLSELWSVSDDVSSEYQVVRLNAFLLIRQLALTQPFPFIESCLKICYLSYAKRAKFANAATVTTLLPTLTFMGNCVVELYSLDHASSYQHAFVYIRQLALHLRTALQKKTPETFSVVYCWQYMHCLKLWVSVLASCCRGSLDGNNNNDETQLLRSLIYPLVEIIFGVSRLIPSARYLPLRFHCVRLLQQLAASTECYIPTTSILFDALDLKEWVMTPKRIQSRGQDIRGIRLAVLLKLPKENTLRTAEQLDACLGETFTLLNRELDLYRFSAGFPEFTVLVEQRVRKFTKEIKNSKFRAFGRGCIAMCEKYSSSALQARSRLDVAPKDIRRLEILRPADVPSMSVRYESAISKEKRFESMSQPVVQSKPKDGKEANKAEQTAPSSSSNDTNQARKSNKSDTNVSKTKSTDGDSVLEEDDIVQEGFSWSDDGSSDVDSSDMDED